MEETESARLAGEAFTMITGVNLELEHLDLDEPPEESGTAPEGEPDPLLDRQDSLPWPSPARVAEWWKENQQTFSTGIRFLAGKPVDGDSALDILHRGKQRQRAAAASELALMNKHQALFNVRARAVSQQGELRRWKVPVAAK